MKLIVLSAFVFLCNLAEAQVELITQTRQSGASTWISYSPSGNFIASASTNDHSIRVWDTRSGKIIGNLYGHDHPISVIYFDTDGRHLFSADKKGILLSWNLENWKQSDSLSLGDDVHAISLWKDHLIAGTVKGQIHLIRKKGLQKNDTFLSGKESVELLVVDEKSDVLFAHTLTKGLQIWDLNSHKKTAQFPTEKDTPSAMYTTGNGKLLIVYSSGKISLWDTGQKKNLLSTNSPQGVTASDFNMKTSVLAVCGKDHKVRLYKTDNLQVEAREITAGEGHGENTIRSLAFSPDGSTIATTGFKTERGFFSGASKSQNTIRVWSVSTGELYSELKGSVRPVIAFGFFPELNRIAILHEGQELSFWDFDLGEKTGTFTLPEAKREYFPKMKHAADNAINNAGSAVNTAQNVLSGNVNLNAKKAAKSAGKATQRNLDKLVENDPVILFSALGKYMITQLPKDEIRIYSVNNGAPQYQHYLKHDLHKLNVIAISPDETQVACGGIGNEFLTICDISNGNLIKSIRLPLPSGTENISELRDICYSNDGKLLAVVMNTGKLFVLDATSHSVLFENLMPVTLSVFHGGLVNFTRDSKYLLYNGTDGLRKVSVGSFLDEKAKTFHVKGKVLPMNSSQNFALSREKTGMNVYDLVYNTEFFIPSNSREVTCVGVSPGGRIALSFVSGEIRLYEPTKGEHIATMVTEGENGIIKTRDNYYKVNKEGYDLVTFRVGSKAYPFEQFDLYFNQPARVLEALGSGNKSLIQLYQTTREKRLKRMGAEKAYFAIEELPVTEIRNRADIPALTNENAITLNIKATDERSGISGFQFWINNVPVFGPRILKTKNRKEADTTIQIPLINGINEIRCAAFNGKGNESLNEAIRIEARYDVPVDLYLVSIGVSNYKDKKFNLQYAAKDARDIAALFNQNNVFRKVESKILTDAEVTKKNVLSLKDFLSKAKLNDVVMVFIAGHGVLDKQFNYYFAPNLMDFNHPEREGISYESLETLVAAVKSIRKILIMDTCHSGEVDKDDVQSTVTNAVETGDVQFRNAGENIDFKDAQQAGASKMMRELFADLRKGTGITAISSAGGTELAMESSSFKNGLFTFCLLTGLKNKSADLNGDQQITSQELQRYLVKEVAEKSQGKQVPTARVDNFMLDYLLWK
ncbi:MAG TPA: caspase family protein [Flavobacteriales bacterium]|nr:caspase family protein [Flavobacteriales bacterium]HRJ34862.1 caspase family protein [Flavobacteriales bacterium]HRJ38772.1 caspase family protein [Flavobacteriales bacterium]